MEEISVNGEIYVKASVLAKNFGYTADYVGQLCRSGQVKATLVGRSWYVNEDSVREHRKGRYRSNSSKAKDHLRQVVEEKIVKTPSPVTHSAPKSRYESDESELFPLLRKLSKDKNEAEETELENIEENTAENKVDMAIEPVLPPETVAIRRGPSPVLRTIPRPVTSGTRPTPSAVVLSPKNKSPRKLEAEPKKRLSLVAALLFILGILVVESTLLFGALGLEKRVLVTADNQAMVLYAFDAEQALLPIKEVLSAR